MIDIVFVLVMAVITGIATYVHYKDTRDEARRWQDLTNRPVPCFRWHCHNPAVEGKAFCADCIADMEAKGIKV